VHPATKTEIGAMSKADMGAARPVTLGGRAWRFPRRSGPPVIEASQDPDCQDHDPTTRRVSSSTMTSTPV